MPTTARDVYAEAVRALPLTEQLRLAALILDELAHSEVSIVEVSIVDASDDWSAEDKSDVTTFALQHAPAAYPEDEELV